MALGDIINKAGSAPGVAPIAPPPPPPSVDDTPRPPSLDEIDPKDVEARREAEIREAQPKLPEPKIPEDYAPRVEEHEPTFGDPDEDELSSVEATDVPPDPFKAPAPEPDLVEPPRPAPPASPTPNMSAGETSSPVGMDWLDVDLPNSAPPQAPQPASTAQYDSSEGDSFGGFDDDFDGGSGSDRADFIKAKTAGLLEKPKEFVKKNPRPVMVGAIGLVALLVMALVLPGGSPEPDPAPPNPVVPTDSLPVPDGEGVGTPVTLFPKKVSANCGAGQTNPALAFNNNQGDAWICPRANGIDGAVLNIMFDRTVQVLSVTIMPGYNYVSPNGKDHWNDHRVVTQILWRAGGKQFVHKIDPTRAGSTFTFNPPKGVATTTMSLTIQRSERPDAAGAEVNPDTGEGGILPPLVGPGGGNDDVDKTFAINSIIITGYELG